MRLDKLASIYAPRENDNIWIATLATFLVVCASWTVILFNWITAKSVNSALAGFFPLWDASAYYQCGNLLIDLGRFHGGLCDNRPIYPSLLASLMIVSGRNLHALLLLQGALVSVAMVMFARELARIAGSIGALVGIILLGAFASRYAFGNVMTENAGLALGCIAFMLLLRGAETSTPWVSYFGIAVLSIALNARAGAFFTLPAAVLWACYDAHRNGRGVFWAFLLASCMAGAGFFLTFALLSLNGVAPSGAHSNFSWYLYGFAVGGKGWAQALIDYPNLSPAELYKVSLKLIMEHPSLILGGLGRNLVEVLRNGVGLYGGYVRGFESVFWGLWLAGVIAIGVRFRGSRYALIGFLEVGNVVSGPFISQDNGARVYAATLPLDVAVVVAGLRLIFDLVLRRSSRLGATMQTLSARRIHFLFAAALIAAVIVPFTPVRKVVSFAKLDGPRCADGDRTLITQLDPGSVAITVTDGVAAIYPPRAPLSALLKWKENDRAIVDSLTQIKPPYSFILAYQRSAFGTEYGRIFPMTWSGDLSGFYGQVVQICFRDADKVRNDLLWGISYIPRSISLISKQH